MVLDRFRCNTQLRRNLLLRITLDARQLQHLTRTRGQVRDGFGHQGDFLLHGGDLIGSRRRLEFVLCVRMLLDDQAMAQVIAR